MIGRKSPQSHWKMTRGDLHIIAKFVEGQTNVT